MAREYAHDTPVISLGASVGNDSFASETLSGEGFLRPFERDTLDLHEDAAWLAAQNIADGHRRTTIHASPRSKITMSAPLPRPETAFHPASLMIGLFVSMDASQG